MTGDRRLTLAVMSAGTAMLLLDVTAVNVALPAIRGRRAIFAAGTPAAGSVAGLNGIFLTAALVVLAAAVAAWPLLRRLGSST